MEAKGRFKGAGLVFGKCCMPVRDEELFGGGRLPLHIPWHVMDVSRYGRSARGCNDCAESWGMDGGFINSGRRRQEWMSFRGRMSGG